MRPRARTAVAASAVTGLALSLGLATNATSSAASSAETVTSSAATDTATTVASAQAPVLAVGKVVDATSGFAAASAGGTEVVAWWVPGLETAKVGDKLPIKVVAATRARADGTYTLRANPTAAMRKTAQAAGGWVNLTVSAISGTTNRAALTGISRRVNAKGWVDDFNVSDTARIAAAKSAAPATIVNTSDVKRTQAASVAASVGRGAEETVTEMENRRPLTHLVLDKNTPAVAPGVVAAMRQARTAGTGSKVNAASAATYCTFRVLRDIKRPVRIAEIHNAANSDLTWIYGQRADTDLQTAINFGGPWGPSVARHVSNNLDHAVEQDYQRVINHYALTSFRFRIGRYERINGTGAGSTCFHSGLPVGTRTATPVNWRTGTGEKRGPGSEFLGCTKKPQKGFRVGYSRGGGMTRKRHSAATISVGATIGVAKLAAKSGHSEYVQLRWKAERGPIWLCGTYQDPPKAGVIHAQNRS